MATMEGWARRAAATASRRKRATNSGSAARWAWSTLTATGRVSTVSVARQTVAMPPEAMGASSRYRPPMVVPRSRGPPLGVTVGGVGSDTGPTLPGEVVAPGSGGYFESTQQAPTTRGPPWEPMTAPMWPSR